MNPAVLNVVKVDPGIGVQVDFDLSAPIGEETRRALVELYERENLLIFANQSLSLERQQEVCGWFGPVLTERIASGYISPDPEKGGLGGGALAFHQDLMCTQDPYFGISLHAVELSGEQATCFIDARAAFTALDASLRGRIAGRTALHVWPTDIGASARTADLDDDWPGASHPIAMPHPRGDYRVLAVTDQQTRSIDGMAAEGGRALLDALLNHLGKPEFGYEHRWRLGDFLLWDNIALQHGRKTIVAGARTLQRACLAVSSGEASMPVAVRDFYLKPVDPAMTA